MKSDKQEEKEKKIRKKKKSEKKGMKIKEKAIEKLKKYIDPKYSKPKTIGKEYGRQLEHFV